MGVWSAIGAGLKTAVGIAVPGVKDVADVVDRFMETDAEKQAWRTVATKVAEKSDEVQNELNKISAQNRTFFTAGWRHFAGWSAAIAWSYHFFLVYVLTWIVAAAGWDLPALPRIDDPATIEAMLYAMLGIAGIRQVDKWTGKAK